mmetsp:Transcript_11096/g.44686  ORF Transcript_11096/g.44686 Transcript_11096/m.44686 type:complete len:902 (+) Transcript_11096:196-2901(+)
MNKATFKAIRRPSIRCAQWVMSFELYFAFVQFGRRFKRVRKRRVRRIIWRPCLAICVIWVYVFSAIYFGSEIKGRGSLFQELPSCKHDIISEAELQRLFTSQKKRKTPFASWKHALRLSPERKYFFALNLRDNEKILPFLFSSIVKACMVLSDDWTLPSCFISIYESGSTDLTRELILDLDRELNHLGVPHKFVVDGVRRYAAQHRIEFLAKIRNEAMSPFYDNMHAWDEVVFINDVAICASSILELLTQKKYHGGDIASGMDYTAHGQDAKFYDIWVNKDMFGDRFNNRRPYIRDPSAWHSFSSGIPFQVFTTWAGGVVMSAELFSRYGVRFRHSGLLECAACECEILIRDLWNHSGSDGLKVMVVPSVYSAYSVREFRIIQRQLESTFRFEKTRGRITDSMVFSRNPPETIDCSGMEFAGDQLIDQDIMNAKSNWLWWYSVNRTKPQDLAELLRQASQLVAQAHSSVCSPPSSLIPANLHFVLPVTEPRRLPHVAFMNMLQWVRLNPCFKVNIHTMASFPSLAAHSGWSISESDLREVSDSRVHYLKYYTQFRLHGLVALHVFGGVFADWEFSPVAPIDLAQLDTFGAAFSDVSYGGGPYITASVPSSRELRDVINFALKMSTNQLIPSEVDTEHATASYMQLRLAMLTVGKLNFDLAGASRHVPHLQSLGVMRLKVLPLISSRARPNIIREGDALMEGEILLSSASSKGSSKGKRQFLDANAPSLRPIHRHGGFYLQLRTSKQRGEGAKYGCLEVRSRNATHSARSDRVVWQECWPGDMELDTTYLEYQHGNVSIITVATELCNTLESDRKVLWSQNMMTVDANPFDTKMENRLSLNEDGLLTSEKVKKQSIFLSRVSERKQRPDYSRLCITGYQGCENLKHWQKQVLRYHSSCLSIV